MQLYLSSMTGEFDKKRVLQVNSKLASIFNAIYEFSGSNTQLPGNKKIVIMEWRKGLKRGI